MNVNLDMLQKIMKHGFVVEEIEGVFRVRKSSGNSGDSENPLESKTYASFHEAVADVVFFIEPPKTMWSVIVRFDPGIGPLMKTLENIEAKDYEEACRIAKVQSEDFLESVPHFCQSNILGIRVRPISQTRSPSADDR